MSSPPPTFLSSPFDPSRGRTPKSRFTYKQLSQLKHNSTTTPLRVIAHIDLDAFYAQCETVRLGLDPGLPLAVQQWQGLIAINYPARASGLTRHITATEALKLCPELRMVHVATWKEGEETWAYREDGERDIATQKVSLDPYRKESRRILKTIKEALPKETARVEKASIDEVFLDLGAHIHDILLARYQELEGPPPYDDASEFLPQVPSSVLDWGADEVVGTGEEDGEVKDPDWDDVCMGIACEIVRHVRGAVQEHLGYTCSAGIARNKMLAKLGSGYKKPNQQTVIRNRAIAHFLGEMKFTKIRMLGGKLGDEVVAMFNSDKVADLLEQPIEQLKRLGDDTGSWLYSIIRGEDTSDVNPRTQIKSMLSAKSFRPAINSFEQGVRWLRIFVADIFSRCVEEGVLENKRRPKTINLHHRQGSQTKSRSSPIPQGKPFSEQALFDLAKNLLAHVVVDGRAWPCVNLSLSVGGFEDGITNNHGIGGFLIRGDQAKAVLSTGITRSSTEYGAPPAKRRRTKGNIANFFGKRDGPKKDFDEARMVLLAGRRESMKMPGMDTDAEAEDDEGDAFEPPPDRHHEGESPDTGDRPLSPHPRPCATLVNCGLTFDKPSIHHTSTGTPPSAQMQTNSRLQNDMSTTEPITESVPLHQQTLNTYFCAQCNVRFPSSAKTEHEDFHYAMDLSKEMRQESRKDPAIVNSGKNTPGQNTAGRRQGGLPGVGRGASSTVRGPGKGQAKLRFGKGG
ncbi:sister chromatid cohesion protein Eso1 [Amniculicola lignicola CBS 123094]|uniref:DNA polymerase eta n=1 Tax=Amniculicola lignicola CBS 123094 TaxID=1392246 RepID=A0A6A5WSL2_9PLEO|nr:sister chromatid cohesion protein Eso1 [Amniculicola lignicola CBS 123094]